MSVVVERATQLELKDIFHNISTNKDDLAYICEYIGKVDILNTHLETLVAYAMGLNVYVGKCHPVRNEYCNKVLHAHGKKISIPVKSIFS